MTRKDYVLIADIIAQFSRDIANDESGSLTDFGRAIVSGERAAAETIAHRLADRLRQDNPRFDRERFMRAACLDPQA